MLRCRLMALPRVALPPILDRYIVREMIAPTLLGLLVFTFVLLIDQIPEDITAEWFLQHLHLFEPGRDGVWRRARRRRVKPVVQASR